MRPTPRPPSPASRGVASSFRGPAVGEPAHAVVVVTERDAVDDAGCRWFPAVETVPMIPTNETAVPTTSSVIPSDRRLTLPTPRRRHYARRLGEGRRISAVGVGRGAVVAALA